MIARQDGAERFLGDNYAVVFEGEIWFELDGGNTVHPECGDVVVQNGNKGTRPVTVLFVLNGAIG